MEAPTWAEDGSDAYRIISKRYMQLVSLNSRIGTFLNIRVNPRHWYTATMWPRRKSVALFPYHYLSSWFFYLQVHRPPFQTMTRALGAFVSNRSKRLWLTLQGGNLRARGRCFYISLYKFLSCSTYQNKTPDRSIRQHQFISDRKCLFARVVTSSYQTCLVFGFQSLSITANCLKLTSFIAGLPSVACLKHHLGMPVAPSLHHLNARRQGVTNGLPVRHASEISWMLGHLIDTPGSGITLSGIGKR